MKGSCCRRENTKVCQQESSSSVLYCAKGAQVEKFMDIEKYEDSVRADGREGKGCNFAAIHIWATQRLRKNRAQYADFSINRSDLTAD